MRRTTRRVVRSDSLVPTRWMRLRRGVALADPPLLDIAEPGMKLGRRFLLFSGSVASTSDAVAVSNPLAPPSANRPENSCAARASGENCALNMPSDPSDDADIMACPMRTLPPGTPPPPPPPAPPPPPPLPPPPPAAAAPPQPQQAHHARHNREVRQCGIIKVNPFFSALYSFTTRT